MPPTPIPRCTFLEHSCDPTSSWMLPTPMTPFARHRVQLAPVMTGIPTNLHAAWSRRAHHHARASCPRDLPSLTPPPTASAPRGPTQLAAVHPEYALRRSARGSGAYRDHASPPSRQPTRVCGGSFRPNPGGQASAGASPQATRSLAQGIHEDTVLGRLRISWTEALQTRSTGNPSCNDTPGRQGGGNTVAERHPRLGSRHRDARRTGATRGDTRPLGPSPHLPHGRSPPVLAAPVGHDEVHVLQPPVPLDLDPPDLDRRHIEEELEPGRRER